jgi:ParB family chromosome partitioning protein
LALVENLQRDDLSAHDEADALGRLVRERHWSTRQLASAIAKSQAYVSRRVRVYEDPALRPLVLRNELSVAIAEELLAASASRRPDLAKQAVRAGWDRRRARAEARGYTAASHPHRRAQVSGLREPIASASLSAGERLMLRQFGEFLLAQVPAVEDTPPS